MMDKRKTQVVCLGMMVMFVCACSAWAQPSAEGDQPRMKRHQDRMEKMAKELNLTSQQQDQINAFRDQHAKQSKLLRQGLQSKRKQLKEELDKPASDKATIESLANDLKQLEGRMIDERIQRVQELKQVLTPEQYRLFQEKVKAQRQQFGERMRNKSKGPNTYR